MALIKPEAKIYKQYLFAKVNKLGQLKINVFLTTNSDNIISKQLYENKQLYALDLQYINSLLSKFSDLHDILIFPIASIAWS